MSTSERREVIEAVLVDPSLETAKSKMATSRAKSWENIGRNG